MTGSPKVWTIPPSVPFLPALADALHQGLLPGFGPDATQRGTILLPTRRAARALQDAFLAASGGGAVILPRIRPISEGDEDLTLLTGLAAAATTTGIIGAGLDTSSAPPISALQRRLALTNLVMAWSRSMRGDDGTIEGAIAVNAAAGRETPAQAANLAAELANLIDMVETENASLDDIAKLVPDQYSDHWQHTIGFLRIVTQFWPAYLDEHGLASPMASRNEAIIREARRLAGAPPRDPVIVAGVTGSIPATAELMRAVADLPNGAIVLPNLDMTLDVGIPSAIFIVFILIVLPSFDYLRTRSMRSNIIAADLFLMILIFTALNAFMEVLFFHRGDPVWMLMVLAVAGMRRVATEPLASGRA